MSNFLQKLEDRVTKSDSLLCIGLDPHIGQVFKLNAYFNIMFLVIFFQ